MGYRQSLERQDRVLAQADPASGNMALVRPVKQEFDRIRAEFPGLIPAFDPNSVSVEGLRLQIASAVGRISAETDLRLEAAQQTHRSDGTNIFIGHGRSLVWHQLKAFLSDRLGFSCDEFNAQAVAGIPTTARLQELLDDAWFAFLVMTAEDLHADNTSHARENVIHEAGLFQGRLGFERAIILLEKDCSLFSNIHGLTHIEFPKGNIEPAFERIRQVLEREDANRRAAFKQELQLVADEKPGADGFEGEMCPKCRQRGWHVESSDPDRQFGELGSNRRLYRCHFCGFSESKLER